MLGRLCARSQHSRNPQSDFARHDARDGRRRQGLSLHDQSRHRVGRRRRDGVSGGRVGREPRVLPVPSDLPVSSCRQVVSDFRSAARRGRDSEIARRHRVHEALPSRRRAGAARRGCARDRFRDEASRPRLRVSRFEPSRGRFHQKAVPEYLQAMLELWLRPHQGPDSGGAGGSLYVRRRADRSRRTHLDSAPVRGRRSCDDRAARRQPARVELAARGRRDGPSRIQLGARNRQRREAARRPSFPNGIPGARFAARSA